MTGAIAEVYAADEAYHACEGYEISKMKAALIASGLRFGEKHDTSLLRKPEKTNQSHYADS